MFCLFLLGQVRVVRVPKMLPSAYIGKIWVNVVSWFKVERFKKCIIINIFYVTHYWNALPQAYQWVKVIYQSLNIAVLSNSCFK